MDKAKIMVVEDERIVARDLARQLGDLGYDVVATAYSGEEAVEKVGEVHPDLVLMDIVLAGKMDGIQAAEKITTLSGTPVVYLTSYADDKTFGGQN
jgi:CheY-like chemotaxis protein